MAYFANDPSFYNLQPQDMDLSWQGGSVAAGDNEWVWDYEASNHFDPLIQFDPLAPLSLQRHVQHDDKPFCVSTSFEPQPDLSRFEDHRHYAIADTQPPARSLSWPAPTSDPEFLSDRSTVSPGHGCSFSPEASSLGHLSLDSSVSFPYQSDIDDDWDTSRQLLASPMLSTCVVQAFIEADDSPFRNEGCSDVEMKSELPLQLEDEIFQSVRLNPRFPQTGDGNSSQLFDSRDFTKCEESIAGTIYPEPLFEDVVDQKEAKEEKDKNVGSVDVDVDADAEADFDDDDDLCPAVAEDSEEDQEYIPPSTRPKRKRTTRRLSPVAPIRRKNRISKAKSSKAKPEFACSICSYVSKDALSLARHNSSAHTRPYICTFAFAGCNSTFGSKNEWKRHVSSQHLALYYWRCEEESCGAAPTRSASTSHAANSGSRVGNEFNRKDLFTQHLRRMHSPLSVRHHNKRSADWDARVKRLQESCLVVRRKPPQRACCTADKCGADFSGTGCWDERMEHVGRHLEKGIKIGDEKSFVDWCLREGIVMLVGSARYKLAPVGSSRDDSDAGGDADEDAEGEMED